MDGDTKHNDLCAWALSGSIEEGWQGIEAEPQVRIK